MESSQQPRDKTPPLQQDTDPNTPLTIRTLRRVGSQLAEDLEGPINPLLLQKFIKGSLAQAQAGAQAVNDLKEQSAQSARRQRKANARKITSTGSVMYASEARRIEQAKLESAVSRQRTARNREKKIKEKGQRAKLRNQKAAATVSGRVVKRKSTSRVTSK
ncbi:hypothetical protein B0J12DRAFT_685176 [Macrophomina phaseolina]|uniref:Uncharacterized protein n=1 Tax=Macrophomina phaseolina TaxID=35725 RepID=A0ABQ8FWH4_9PEZI|nr:hypothetical protein B0J12DRAFT_685176 [Macrophomina phaseolina]